MCASIRSCDDCESLLDYTEWDQAVTVDTLDRIFQIVITVFNRTRVIMYM